MLVSQAARASCFDASALAKLYVNESGSGVLRKYFGHEPTKYTTPFCYFETLTLLKVMCFYRKIIADDEYHNAVFDLTAWFGAFSEELPDIKLTSPIVLHDAQQLARKHELDLSDAFQILSVKSGYFSRLTAGSQTILCTADGRLATAARREGLRVWNLMTEPMPS